MERTAQCSARSHREPATVSHTTRPHIPLAHGRKTPPRTSFDPNDFPKLGRQLGDDHVAGAVLHLHAEGSTQQSTTQPHARRARHPPTPPRERVQRRTSNTLPPRVVRTMATRWPSVGSGYASSTSDVTFFLYFDRLLAPDCGTSDTSNAVTAGMRNNGARSQQNNVRGPPRHALRRQTDSHHSAASRWTVSRRRPPTLPWRGTAAHSLVVHLIQMLGSGTSGYSRTSKLPLMRCT